MGSIVGPLLPPTSVVLLCWSCGAANNVGCIDMDNDLYTVSSLLSSALKSVRFPAGIASTLRVARDPSLSSFIIVMLASIGRDRSVLVSLSSNTVGLVDVKRLCSLSSELLELNIISIYYFIQKCNYLDISFLKYCGFLIFRQYFVNS